MASSGKTPKLGLNQWARTDGVCMDDFNADNAALDALGSIPLFKIREVVTAQTASVIELDLSDLDMTQWAELWIDFRLNAGGSFRLNNISASKYQSIWGNASNDLVYWSDSATSATLLRGLYKFSLGSYLAWASPDFFGRGYLESSALVPASWTSLTLTAGSTAFAAGGKIRIYGVKLL